MIVKSLDHLNVISKKIINKINKQDCIFIFGEIGAGKTTLTRAIINNFETENRENETQVLSPTFNIVYEYESSNYKIMHYDLYRLKTEKEVKQLNIFDQDSSSIKIIEWPEIIKNKPEDRLEIYLYHKHEEDLRNIDFKTFGRWKGFSAD